MRYFIGAVSHGAPRSAATGRKPLTAVDEQHGVGFGKPGVSAMVNGLDQLRFERFQRAPLMSTSSAVRSPDPWNQHTSRSLVRSSTIDEEWLCQDSSGKMSSPETAARQPGRSSTRRSRQGQQIHDASGSVNDFPPLSSPSTNRDRRRRRQPAGRSACLERTASGPCRRRCIRAGRP